MGSKGASRSTFYVLISYQNKPPIPLLVGGEIRIITHIQYYQRSDPPTLLDILDVTNGFSVGIRIAELQKK